MLWRDNTVRRFTAAAVNGSARWPIFNERRSSIRATPRSRPESDRLIWHCVCGRMRSVPNCELWPSTRTTRWQRFFFSALASTQPEMSARRTLDGFPEAINSLTRGTGIADDVVSIIGIWAYLDVIERRFTDAFQAF